MRGPPVRGRLVLVLALLPGVWACGGRDDADVETRPGAETGPGVEATTDAVRVTDVNLGTALGPDNRVAAGSDTDTFRPTDTVYASVATEGTATGSTLTARWTYQDGQVVDETTQTISAAGAAVTGFHISMPDGFPAGQYQLELLLNGQSTERRSFTVR
jgi:uncharacterized protein YfaS (alpha-2-macroglobulin family)